MDRFLTSLKLSLASGGTLLYRKRPMDLSTRNLMQALAIRRQIDALEQRLKGLVGGMSGAPPAGSSRAGRPRLSASARAKIAAAARARWARVRAHGGGAKVGKKRKGRITAAGRRRLSQLMKARWAARRKAKRK
jgi:hypothetical protein